MLQVVLIWLALTTGMILGAEAGYRVHRAVWPGGKAQQAEAASMIMAAILALMGLLTAFTFSMANSRYDQRRDLAVAEANAISTTYLRQQLLAGPERTQLVALMRDYATSRRAVVDREEDDPEVAAAQRRSADLQVQIWRLTVQALNTPEGARISIPLLTATNEMFDMAEARRAAIEAMIPVRELRVLLALAFGASVMTGVALATRGTRQFAASSIMFGLFALTMSLIRDLDTSNSGGIRTPVAALDRVAEQIVESAAAQGAPPARPDR